ncbi:TRI15 protein, partial [Pachycephala philippinensis]|nr:TRI15 protein [Pachycephala philippinensis]
LGRALTSPPTPLPLPRLPRRLRVALDYDGGRVAFFDGDSRSPTPLFAFPTAAFDGERVRPWFWLELGEISIVQ